MINDLSMHLLPFCFTPFLYYSIKPMVHQMQLKRLNRFISCM